jgi:hypothetical protein
MIQDRTLPSGPLLRISLLRHAAILLDSEGCGIKPGLPLIHVDDGTETPRQSSTREER